jgi:hypothetical protein
VYLVRPETGQQDCVPVPSVFMGTGGNRTSARKELKRMINFMLWSDIIIRILSMGVLILAIVSSLYFIKINSKHKKELSRLKELNDEIEAMLQEEKK